MNPRSSDAPPAAIVIFGASGDLTRRKLLPALFHLEQAGLLPDNFAIVGVVRRPLGDEFAQDMRGGIIEFGGVDEGDAMIRLAWAEALAGTGQVDAAREAIRAARDRLIERAARVTPPIMRWGICRTKYSVCHANDA